MATLVSPGVSVTVTDQSFYIPASAPTVPLIFVATQANKTQPNGAAPAAGTSEHSVVRAVTSIGQSVQLYGIPYFWTDSSGNAFNGDARNEYGLFALNEFLSIGNLAYVVRANVDLSDQSTSFYGIGTPIASSITFTGVGNGTISNSAGVSGTAPTASSAFVQPQTIDVIMNTATTFTVQGSISGIIGFGTVGTPFTSTIVNFEITAGSTPFSADDYFQFSLVYGPSSYTGTGNGTMTNVSVGSQAVAETWTVVIDNNNTSSFTVTGSIHGASSAGTVGQAYSNSYIGFTINAGTTAFVGGDTFTLAVAQVVVSNPLGSTDAAKRVTITTALAAEINNNPDVQSETYQYNLILCPGYWEVATDLVNLSNTINGEALVIADTPSTLTPEQTVAWASTSARMNGTNIAYYYPWGQAANLDGSTVVVAPSGIALATIAYSDSVSYIWFAPAGARRGLVSGISSVGYVSGQPGTAAAFTQVNLNQGQRDLLYQYPTNINPIVYFPSQGLLVWGQKTSQPTASAMDRINVSRLVMYIKRQLRIGAMPFVFEPNDSITQANLGSSASSFLNDILSKRGLYDFVVLCNASNNPPSVVEANELYMDVAIQPVIAAEFIYIPITVLSTGATLPS
jgi:phage tail sheath protein FI